MGAVVILLGVAGIALLNFYLIISDPISVFVGNILIIIGELLYVGYAINGQISGVLIDNRNRISLSKFQMIGWTVLVTASLVAIASHNLGVAFDQQPLNFEIPAPLLAAMGISAASFVTAPVVLSLKTGQLPTSQDAETAKTLAAKTAGSTAAFAGKIFGRSLPKGASWLDMLVGEEVGTCATPDIGKLQQLMISLLLLGIYGFAVRDSLGTSAKIAGLPPLGENFVWLLAISHASYLAYKAAPHTSDGTSTDGQRAPPA